MAVRFTDMNCKEVICIRDGRRLGFVSDLRVEVPDGRVIAIVVPGRGRLFGLMSCREEFVIPWECIRRIGPDIVLVDIRPEDHCAPRPKRFPLGNGGQK